MTPVAIKTAAKTGFPVDHVIGGIWSSSEEDVIPAGPVGKGYLAITTYPAGTNFPIHAALKKNILDAGKSDLKDPKSFGTVYYNSGIVHAVILTEAIRTAQAKFGNRPINGAEGQWGLEHLKVDDKRLEELGVAGLMQPLKLSCLDHEGGGSARNSCPILPGSSSVSGSRRTPCRAASASSVARATSGRTSSICSAVISESRPNRQ